MLIRKAAALAAIALAGCGAPSHPKVIVLGVDGMDPGFVARYQADLPNLDALRHSGEFVPLATTNPPQSPVAWSTFATGLEPADHGIFDFVHRDPKTREPFLSTDRTVESRFRLPLGPWVLPLAASRVESLRRGAAFWQTLAERGVPVTIVRMPVNYPPLPYGREISGMGTPDLRGTQGTFTFFTDAPGETARSVPGGLIRPARVIDGTAELRLEGPPNTLRRDRALAAVTITVDVDADNPVAHIEVGDQHAVLRQGEWSDWIPADFPLIPHLVSVRGMFRVYAKQLRPRFELYISPINIDPEDPAAPISYPVSFAAEFGRFPTLGIPEDTAALRQGVFDLPEFLTHSRMVLATERRMLSFALDRYRDGLLFYYFSAVDQNSHILWRRHDAALLEIYRAVDASVGEVARREPDATLIVMSDHGFTTFDRAVNLNAWLRREGFTRAYAMGLNALYLNGDDAGAVRRALLGLRDPESGASVVVSAAELHPAPTNRAVAPDLIVGYAPGYRASWATGVGESAEAIFETNQDAWIADHCVDPAAVPGVLFSNRKIAGPAPSLKTLSGTIMKLFGAVP